MRILLITQYWAPENGVPQRRWNWLTELLLENGHEIMVVAPPAHYLRKLSLKEWVREKGFRSYVDEHAHRPKLQVVRSGYFPGGTSITEKVLNQCAVAAGSLMVLFRRKGVVADFAPDLVIGTVPAIPTALVTFVASRRFRVPYVIDLRDAWPELLQVTGKWNIATGTPSLRQRVLSKGPLQFAVKLTDFVLSTTLRRAESVIATSENLCVDLNQRFKEWNRAVTVRNVFPPETLIDKEIDFDRKAHSLNVLYAGTLGRAQNLDNALQAAKIAQVNGVEVKLRFVGAGAAKQELISNAARMGLNAVFEERRGPEQLEELYEWADTALVHLTDWEPLRRAVPSKTYELMDQGLHISAAVAGETADLVSSLAAGDVVAPEEPHQLASLWEELARDRARLQVPQYAREWVREQRTRVAPRAFLSTVEK